MSELIKMVRGDDVAFCEKHQMADLKDIGFECEGDAPKKSAPKKPADKKSK